MPPAAAAGIAVVGGIASAYGQKQAAKKQNKYQQQAAGQLSPAELKKRIQGLNPQLYQAAYGRSPFQASQWDLSGGGQPGMGSWLDYQASLGRQVEQNPLAQLFKLPGYMDPRQMNYGLTMSAQQGQQNMQDFAAQVGRGGFEGGMATAYALANRAAQSQRNNQMWQQYMMAREQQRRGDIAQGQGLLSEAQQAATGQASTSAGYLAQRTPPPSGMAMLGQGISTGLQAYGAMQQPRGQQQPPRPQPYAPSTVPDPRQSGYLTPTVYPRTWTGTQAGPTP